MDALSPRLTHGNSPGRALTYGVWGRRAALHLGLVAAQRDLERGLGGAISDASDAALTSKR